jgi:hypothetical protein
VPTSEIAEMDVDQDTRSRLLADDRRRVLLAVLDPDRRPVALADLARRVAVLECEGATDVESELADARRIYRSLYHVHVPMLADAGIVSFDPDRRTVATGPNFDAVRSQADIPRGAQAGVCS